MDVSLAEGLQPLRLLLGKEGHHGSTGKPLQRLPVSSGETVDLGAGGKPRLSEPVVALTNDGGDHHIHIRIDSIKDLDWALSKVRRQVPGFSVTADDIRHKGTAAQERLDGEIRIPIALGGLDFFRAVVKSAVNLLAAHSED